MSDRTSRRRCHRIVQALHVHVCGCTYNITILHIIIYYYYYCYYYMLITHNRRDFIFIYFIICSCSSRPSAVFSERFFEIQILQYRPGGLEPIIYYIILCLIRALLLLLHMAIITCNTVFSENPLRAVGYFVYIRIRWRKLLIYRETRSIFLNVILFSVFVYRDVALLCYYIVGHAAHETCTYMCRK